MQTMQTKANHRPEEIFAEQGESFGTALSGGCKGGVGLRTSGQNPTTPFRDPGGTGTKADGDGLTEPWI